METVLYHNQRNEVGAKMDGLEARGGGMPYNVSHCDKNAKHFSSYHCEQTTGEQGH